MEAYCITHCTDMGEPRVPLLRKPVFPYETSEQNVLVNCMSPELPLESYLPSCKLALSPFGHSANFWFFLGGYQKLRAALVAQMVKHLPQCRRHRFDTWVRKVPWRKEWLPTPVFLPGEFHGQRSLVGYSPWDRKGLDRTE